MNFALNKSSQTGLLQRAMIAHVSSEYLIKRDDWDTVLEQVCINPIAIEKGL